MVEQPFGLDGRDEANQRQAVFAAFFDIDGHHEFVTAILAFRGAAGGQQKLTIAPEPRYAIGKRGENGLKNFGIAMAVAAGDHSAELFEDTTRVAAANRDRSA